MFPRSLKKFYDQCIRFKGVDGAKIKSWKKDYELLITKALHNTNRERFLSKNPPNTGRIEVLLEMFPNAKFIHIHRNPVEVYLSTQNFFNKMLPHLQLQSIDPLKLEEDIILLYKDIMQDYLKQREMIPAGQLAEISFEELEKNPKLCIKNLYNSLGLSGYQKSESYFESYLDSKKSYQKNKHHITAKLIHKIETEWGFAMKEWSYDVPEHIEIIHEDHK